MSSKALLSAKVMYRTLFPSVYRVPLKPQVITDAVDEILRLMTECYR